MTSTSTLARGAQPPDAEPPEPGAESPGAGPPEPVAEAPLYVISTHQVRDRTGRPPYRWVPYGVEHAWQPGTHRTLCGQWTSGWTVFWERRFSATPDTACQDCVEASLPDASRRKLDPVRRDASRPSLGSAHPA